MYCCKCGVKNPDDASYCNKCGSPLYLTFQHGHGPRQPIEEGIRDPVRTQMDEERRGISELLSIDPKPHQCHGCRTEKDLYGYDFGLAKVMSARRNWGEAAWSAAVSAVSLPLLGYGILQLPGKKSRLRVLRLRLILCESCRRRRVSYLLHPWWEPARRLGFTQFLSADDLDRLEPA